MPITYLKTDIFTSPATTIMIPVNCVGVMGKGLAKQCKERYPDVEKKYKQDCANGLVKIGLLRLYYTHDKNIIAFPTKMHYRRPSHYEYISQGMGIFLYQLQEWNLESVAIPQLGCGEGGLEWEGEGEKSVKMILEHTLSRVPELNAFIHIWEL